MAELPAELLERAKRHGLEQREGGFWCTGNTQVVWGSGNRWVWCPAEERISSSSPPYPSPAHALRTCLDWLDTQHPKLAWKPVPWAPVVAVLATLRRVHGELTEAPSIAARSEASSLQAAIEQLERAVLGPSTVATLEDGLRVLVDLRLEQGELGEALREQLRRVLQAHPDEALKVVHELRVAGRWTDRARFLLQGPDFPIGDGVVVGDVDPTPDGWTAEALSGPLTNERMGGLWPSEQAAMAAVDGALLRAGFGLAGGAVQAPVAEPAAPAPDARADLLQEVRAAIALLEACPDASDRIGHAWQVSGLGRRRGSLEQADEERLRRYYVELRAITPPQGTLARCLDCEGSGRDWSSRPFEGPPPACRRCGGGGLAVACPRCEGHGTIVWGYGEDVSEGDCPTCSGGSDPDYDDDPAWEDA